MGLISSNYNLSIVAVDAIINKAFKGLPLKTSLADLVDKFATNLKEKTSLYAAELAVKDENRDKLNNIIKKWKFLDRDSCIKLNNIFLKIRSDSKRLIKICDQNHILIDKYQDFIKRADKAELTPAIYAIKQNSEQGIKILRLLLDLGLDAQERSRDGLTPLMYAIKVGNRDAVGLLLDSGEKEDCQGQNPINYAIDVNPDMVEFLVGRKVKEDGVQDTPLTYAVRIDNPGLFEFFIKRGSLIDEADKNGLTPMHKAILDNNVRMLKLLGNLGIDF